MLKEKDFKIEDSSETAFSFIRYLETKAAESTSQTKTLSTQLLN